MEMGGGIRRFRNRSVAGTVRWPITLAILAHSNKASNCARLIFDAKELIRPSRIYQFYARRPLITLAASATTVLVSSSIIPPSVLKSRSLLSHNRHRSSVSPSSRGHNSVLSSNAVAQCRRSSSWSASHSARPPSRIQVAATRTSSTHTCSDGFLCAFG